MSAYRRGLRYRRGGKRGAFHNRSVATVVFLLLFIAAVIFGTVKLGKYLGEKGEHSKESRESDPIEAYTGTEVLLSQKDAPLLTDSAPVGINSSFLSLSGIGVSDDALAERTAPVAENTAVTLIFRSTDGTLYYASPAAAAVGSTAGGDLPDAGKVIGALKEKNCYVSVMFGISEKRTDETENAALRAFEKAMISETVGAGADEVILCAPSLSADALPELEAFAGDVRQTCLGKARLGIFFARGFFDGDFSAVTRELAEYFEIFAADLPAAVSQSAETDTDTNASENGNKENTKKFTDEIEFFVTRYNVRIVIDADGTEEHADFERTESVSFSEFFGTHYDTDIDADTDTGDGSSAANTEE